MVNLVLALTASLALLAGLLFIPTGSAGAQTPCVATINGVDTALHSTYKTAIDIGRNDTVALAMATQGGIGSVNVQIAAGPVQLGLPVSNQRGGAQARAWAGNVEVEDKALTGAGLYEVTLTSSGGCNLKLWVNVTGASPLSTPAGGAAGTTLIAGVLAQLGAIIRALRGRNGLALALIGGLVMGLSACVIAQQAGVTPISARWAAVWSAPPMVIGSVLQGGASLFSRERGQRIEYERAGAPPTTAAGPPPDVAPQPRNGGGGPGAEPPAGNGAPPPAMAEPPPSMGPSESAPVATPSAAPPQAAESAVTMAEPERGPLPEPVTANGGEGAAAPYQEPAAANGDAAAAPPVLRSSLPASEAVADPPRTAFALLDCPDAVVATSEFELLVGLGAEATPGVTGGALVRPEGSRGPYVLTVQVVADGFSLREGENWRHDIPVTVDAPYPSFVVHLTPEEQAEAIKPRAIQAIYSVGGQPMGYAVRSIAVVRTASLADTMQPQPAPSEMTMRVPADEPAADLTVRIQRGDSESGGKLIWTFDMPHEGIDLPDAPIVTDIGDEPEKFARQLIDTIGVREGQPGLQAFLLGVGLTITDQMPAEFWDLLAKVASVAEDDGRKASVFILSEEPYVPWELAALDPPFDKTLPRFLGAQACVGRWVLGQRRPTLPPPLDVPVRAMAVISGIYEQPGWNRLLEAEQEAASIAQAYSAASVKATTVDVLSCLGGTPAADALHFAMHGIYDPNSVLNGLVLTDGLALDPLQVKSFSFATAPFVFLNACQVGSGNKILGDYSGMAEAFLYAGAAAVVAPLWSIDDATAREIAIRFYSEAFAGTPPAEILRRERAGFGRASGPNAATCLAYIWFGHPSFSLNRPT